MQTYCKSKSYVFFVFYITESFHLFLSYKIRLG